MKVVPGARRPAPGAEADRTRIRHLQGSVDSIKVRRAPPAREIELHDGHGAHRVTSTTVSDPGEFRSDTRRLLNRIALRRRHPPSAWRTVRTTVRCD